MTIGQVMIMIWAAAQIILLVQNIGLTIQLVQIRRLERRMRCSG